MTEGGEGLGSLSPIKASLDSLQRTLRAVKELRRDEEPAELFEDDGSSYTSSEGEEGCDDVVGEGEGEGPLTCTCGLEPGSAEEMTECEWVLTRLARRYRRIREENAALRSELRSRDTSMAQEASEHHHRHHHPRHRNEGTPMRGDLAPPPPPPVAEKA
eukprot:RCo040815